MIKTSDIKQKEVINIKNGRRLGLISDMEIDLGKGIVESIVVPGENKILSFFGGGTDYIIPWEKIKHIGVDVILVEVDDTYEFNEERTKRKNFI